MADLSENALNKVPVEVRVTVGHARPSVAELMQLRQDAVLELDRTVSDPVELYIGDRLIARGELEELEGAQSGQLAVRLTQVAKSETAE